MGAAFLAGLGNAGLDAIAQGLACSARLRRKAGGLLPVALGAVEMAPARDLLEVAQGLGNSMAL